jgi:hypothetical protein
MMDIEKMTRDERNQLLFLETCAVDHDGFVDVRKMNDDDAAISKGWDAEGFIIFKRVPAKEFMSPQFRNVTGHLSRYESSYVILSDEAWKVAEELRQRRAKAMKEQRLDPMLIYYERETEVA